VIDKVPSSDFGVRAGQLNRQTAMNLRANLLKGIYVFWLVWAWIAFVPALVSGANPISAPSLAVVFYTAIVVGLLCDVRLAWLASPLPALFVAGFGVPWLVLNVGTALGFDWYHDSPGLATTLLVDAVLPIAALVALVLLWQERRKVFSLFSRERVTVYQIAGADA